jgi:hypothetical protein
MSLERTSTLDRACPKEIRAPPLLIGVAGGTASGKTTVCYKIAEVMADDRVAIISMDNFYRALTPQEKASVDGAPCLTPALHNCARSPPPNARASCTFTPHAHMSRAMLLRPPHAPALAHRCTIHPHHCFMHCTTAAATENRTNNHF